MVNDDLFSGFREATEIEDTRYSSEPLIGVPEGKIEATTYTCKVARETGERVENFLKGYKESDKAKIISVLLDRGLADLPQRKENGERIFHYIA